MSLPGLVTAAVLLVACARVEPTAFERGLAAYSAGRHRAAVAAFDEVIRREPSSVSALSNRGAARARVGDLVGALADYDRAIWLAPRDLELYFHRGNVLVAAGEPGRAVSDFTRAIEVDALEARAYYNRGTARVLAGDPEGREDQLTAVDVEVDPWTKADMRRRLGLTPAAPLPTELPSKQAAGTAASETDRSPEPSASDAPPERPLAAEGEPGVIRPPGTEAADGPEVASGIRTARALAARGLGRELDGDHTGAIADLRAALSLESDETRRATIENLLRLLTGR